MDLTLHGGGRGFESHRLHSEKPQFAGKTGNWRVSSRTLWSLVLQPLLQPEPLRRGPSRRAWRRTRDRHRKWDGGEYLVSGRETSLGPPPRGTRARVCSRLMDEPYSITYAKRAAEHCLPRALRGQRVIKMLIYRAQGTQNRGY
jgi:hypothetical protein